MRTLSRMTEAWALAILFISSVVTRSTENAGLITLGALDRYWLVEMRTLLKDSIDSLLQNV